MIPYFVESKQFEQLSLFAHGEVFEKSNQVLLEEHRGFRDNRETTRLIVSMIEKKGD